MCGQTKLADIELVTLSTGVRQSLWERSLQFKHIGIDICNLISQAVIDGNWGDCYEKSNKIEGPISSSTIMIPLFVAKAIAERAEQKGVTKRAIVSALLRKQTEIMSNKIDRCHR